MSKVKLISIIYAIGIIIGALFFEVCAAETSFINTIVVLLVFRFSFLAIVYQHV